MVLAHLRVTGGNSQGVVQTNDPKETLEIEKVKLEAMKLKLQYELTERDNAKIKFQFEEQRREEERQERALERQHELHLLQLKASPVAPQTSEPVNFDSLVRLPRESSAFTPFRRFRRYFFEQAFEAGRASPACI
ncbi:hypothetical protein Pcinc_015401 [Petrolisthes cinctipes]|uniref:Uncharacterized protein n=1 Tax=Petrolisthes cinctipes TaxID=88211 RepID=A0AAE1FT36_PETCI|nr:hypothetical protein Pcinc_016825 [Petrolisthes cinctipes]KAK3880062.1 hypothetical protein Pcinc_015401 [Petrolisthes cinctipes]